MITTFRTKRTMALAAASLVTLLSVTSLASAAGPVVVSPSNTQGWSTADTRPGGAVSFVPDTTTPGGSGALQLTTDLTTTAKAQYLHAASTTLASVNSMSYYTKQISAPFPGAGPSYQVVTYLNGGTNGFSTLVFEPYQNPSQGAVVNNTWQRWDVGAGLFWSTRTVTCSNGVITGTPGGPASYTLAQIKAACPNAVVAGFGVNIGSNNPGYTVRTDLLNFNGTVYDFEVTNSPRNENQCKKGGYKNFTDAQGNSFKNQGQCIKYVKGLNDHDKGDKNDEHNDGQDNKDNGNHDT